MRLKDVTATTMLSVKHPLAKTIEVLLVDDHEIVRRGLRFTLETASSSIDFNVTEAENGEHALKICGRKEFNLLIIDYRLPGINGDETLRLIKERHPHIHSLAISISDDPACVQDMMRSGADGYILKNVDGAQLLQAIRMVLNGEKYFSSEVAMRLIEMEKEENRVRRLYDQYNLTQRELEVLKLIAQEQTNDDISKTLFISKRTVDTHRQNLLHKLQVKNTAGLVLAAINLKLI